VVSVVLVYVYQPASTRCNNMNRICDILITNIGTILLSEFMYLDHSKRDLVPHQIR